MTCCGCGRTGFAWELQFCSRNERVVQFVENSRNKLLAAAPICQGLKRPGSIYASRDECPKNCQQWFFVDSSAMKCGGRTYEALEGIMSFLVFRFRIGTGLHQPINHFLSKRPVKVSF